MENFSEETKKVLKKAGEIAVNMNSEVLSPEHILIGIIELPNNIGKSFLEKKHISKEAVYKVLETIKRPKLIFPFMQISLAPETKTILDIAASEARAIKDELVQPKHLLLALLKFEDSWAYRIIHNLGYEPNDLYNEFHLIVARIVKKSRFPRSEEENGTKGKGGNKFDETPTLEEHSRDLTEQARKNELDPVIKRDKEIEQIIMILMRRKKNNPVLIGEPGVGKTAIVEGLAQKIIKGEVPENIKNSKIKMLDIASIVAGTKYRGQFESRMKKILHELEMAKDIILFLDELHLVVGAGSAEGPWQEERSSV